MDILKLLKEKGNELYLEELEYYITELETGDYSEVYIKECIELIDSIRNWKISKNSKSKKSFKPSNLNDILLNPSDLIKDFKEKEKSNLTIEEQIKLEIENMRKKSNYNELFKNYINSSSIMDEKMIEQLFKFFQTWELEELLVIKSFSEEFLEKYFDDLDHAKIARYQYFSEDFFIKHYNDLSYSTVLQKGVNEWRKKTNRSKKLDVFLRLKGVTI